MYKTLLRLYVVKNSERRVSCAEGARIEGAERGGVGSGEGCSLPIRLGGLGKRRKLPLRGPGRSPGRQRVLLYFRVKKTSFGQQNTF